jgi:hypothetical protein
MTFKPGDFVYLSHFQRPNKLLGVLREIEHHPLGFKAFISVFEPDDENTFIHKIKYVAIECLSKCDLNIYTGLPINTDNCIYLDKLKAYSNLIKIKES